MQFISIITRALCLVAVASGTHLYRQRPKSRLRPSEDYEKDNDGLGYDEPWDQLSGEDKVLVHGANGKKAETKNLMLENPAVNRLRQAYETKDSEVKNVLVHRKDYGEGFERPTSSADSVGVVHVRRQLFAPGKSAALHAVKRRSLKGYQVNTRSGTRFSKSGVSTEGIPWIKETTTSGGPENVQNLNTLYKCTTQNTANVKYGMDKSFPRKIKYAQKADPSDLDFQTANGYSKQDKGYHAETPVYLDGRRIFRKRRGVISVPSRLTVIPDVLDMGRSRCRSGKHLDRGRVLCRPTW